MRCALAILMAVLLPAQQQETFDAQSRLVLVPVTVVDSKGRFIDGLEAADFIVLDNGRPQPVTVDTLATGVAPIALVIGVQTSGISVPVLEKVRRIGSMVQPLVTGSRGCAALVAFAQTVRWLAECANDTDPLQRALAQLQPGEAKSGRMLDAASGAIDRLRKMANHRRVLLLISESRDRSSESDLESVVHAAQAASVTVYAATYSAFKTAFTTKASSRDPIPSRPVPPRYDPKNPPRRDREPIMPPPEQRVDILGGLGELNRLGKPNTAQILASATGGTTFPFTRQKGLETAIEKLGAELHSQYVLSFSPATAEQGFHRLEVKLARAGEYRLRTRAGYWAR